MAGENRTEIRGHLPLVLSEELCAGIVLPGRAVPVVSALAVH